jgi:endonuclease YncB( thermonuclease family)
MTPPPSFLEFVAAGAKAVTNCTVEVESSQGGKLRLELKGVATTELADLIRAFVSH